MSSPLDALADLFAESERPEQSLVMVNRTELDAVQTLLSEAFVEQSVEVVEKALDTEGENVVALVRDGEVVASSPLADVMNAFLLVNGDLYRSGSSGVDKYEAPSVLTGLDETVFDLRGFPATNKEKLLLIVVSRSIEARALDAGEGTLRSTFQRLSRIADERGTAGVYDRLGSSGVETHVYGQPGWEPPAEFGAEVHAGTHEGYRRSWCVVYTPPDGAEGHVALVAVETGPNEWRGMWTYRPELVERTDRVLAERF